MTNHENSRLTMPQQQRGVVAVQVAVIMVLLLGFATLTVDVGAMYNTRADLQRTADAAALAAAGMLSEYENGDPLDLARAAALEYTQRNDVFGRSMTLDTGMDVQFGRVQLDAGTGLFDFVETAVLPDAVMIKIRHTDDSPNGSVPLYFARVFGFSSAQMSANAIAVMVPRDISIVADLSASHNDDSELKSYKKTDINLMDVWDGLPVMRGVNGVGDGVNAPPPGDPFNPAPAPAFGLGAAGDGGADPGMDPTGGMRGPTFGQLYWWGDSLDPNNYDPTTDPALVALPRYQNWTNADLVTMYQNIGYSADEVTALMANTYDSQSGSKQHWSNRVAVALGLARWDSGQPGGLWETTVGLDPIDAGNGNDWVGSGEMTWLVDYPFPSGSWGDWIYNYMRKSNTRMAKANVNFRYRFGLKTFVNYLLERKQRHSHTPDLENTPHQPMQAVKDAVDFMVEVVDGLNTDDQLSLESYGTAARHEVDLTHDHLQISARLNDMQAGHYDPWTNMGGGIERAIEELSSGRARPTSVKMIILLTDGKANVTVDGAVGDYFMGADYALAQAQIAASMGYRLFAVSVGADADQVLMQQIADIGQGEHFHAEGSIEEYSAQLAEIFRRLGGTRPVELIQ